MASTRRLARAGFSAGSSQFGRQRRDPDLLLVEDDYDNPSTYHHRLPERPRTAQPLLQTAPSPPALAPSTIPKPKFRASEFRSEADYEDPEPPEDDIWAGNPAPYLISNSRCSSSYGERTPDGDRACCGSGRRASREDKVSKYPGPGSYDTSLKPGGPSFSLGSRDSLKRAVGPGIFSPGPGAYNVRMRSSGPSFPMGQKFRMPASQQDMNPGPGTYSDLPGAFGRGLSFTMREKLK